MTNTETKIERERIILNITGAVVCQLCGKLVVCLLILHRIHIFFFEYMNALIVNCDTLLNLIYNFLFRFFSVGQFYRNREEIEWDVNIFYLSIYRLDWFTIDIKLKVYLFVVVYAAFFLENKNNIRISSA